MADTATIVGKSERGNGTGIVSAWWLGATHVLNSRKEGFRSELVNAVDETGATIAVDAIGGGSLGSDILQAMEQAASRKIIEYSRHGSNTRLVDYAETVLRMADGLPKLKDFGPAFGVRRACPRVDRV